MANRKAVGMHFVTPSAELKPATTFELAYHYLVECDCGVTQERLSALNRMFADVPGYQEDELAAYKVACMFAAIEI